MHFDVRFNVIHYLVVASVHNKCNVFVLLLLLNEKDESIATTFIWSKISNKINESNEKKKL